MPPVWRVELLGNFRAVRGNLVVSHFRTRRVASLFAYLSYLPNRSHPRDELAEMLWPDQEVEVGRRNLRQALSSLRQALDDSKTPILQTYHDSVGLVPDSVTTDVGEFERNARAAMAEKSVSSRRELSLKAVHLYRGDLLPGFSEDWILGERLRLEDLFLTMLRNVVEGIPKERWGEAAGFLRLGVSKEPLNEAWNVALVETYLEGGQLERALLQLDQYKSGLARELGEGPSEAVLKLERRALDQKADRTRTGTPVRTVLPPIFTATFGREKEILHLEASVESASRLVTITGAAGIGKTRLATQIGSRFADRGSWNVFFVPAAECDDAACLLDSICTSVLPTKGTPSDPVAAIAKAVEAHDTLLILDNLEQMVEDGAVTVAALLEATPKLRLLVTTRQRLEVNGEIVFGLSPLAVPKTGDSQSPTVQLFLNRCESAGRPIDRDQVEAAIALCQDLEGVPLAVEIAAGLCATLSPSQVREHLPVRLSAVSSPDRSVAARHRSLEDALGTSFQALPGSLQHQFAQLAVFRGDFSVDAAARICAPFEPIEASEWPAKSFQAVLELQKRSLLESNRGSGQALRFKLLNPFREFGLTRLTSSEIDHLRSRHAAYFLGIAPEEDLGLTMATQGERHAWIDLEYSNLIAACEHCLASRRIADAVRLLGALALRWFTRGPRGVERALIRKIADREDFGELSPVLQVRLLRMLGTTYIRSSEYDRAYSACERAVEIARLTQDRELLAVAYSGLSICTGYLRLLEETRELNLKVLEYASPTSYRLRERSFLGLGSVSWNQGNLEQAEQEFLEAKKCSEASSDGEPDVLVFINLCRIALDLGRPEQALKLCAQAMRESERRNDELGMAVSLTVKSRIFWLKGDLKQALELNLDALRKSIAGDFSYWVFHSVRSCALMITDLGLWAEATTLIAASADLSRKGRALEDEELDRHLARLKEGLGQAAFDSAWYFGLSMSQAEASQMATDITISVLPSC